MGIRTGYISARTILQFFGIMLLVGTLTLYIVFQARNIIQGPTVTFTGVYEPVSHTRHITVNGVAQNIVKLTLNGKEIHTNKTGIFSHDLVLENGYTILTIEAQDRFGRTISLAREYVYLPVNAEIGTSSSTQFEVFNSTTS